jgi:hypothetical protein
VVVADPQSKPLLLNVAASARQWSRWEKCHNAPNTPSRCIVSVVWGESSLFLETTVWVKMTIISRQPCSALLSVPSSEISLQWLSSRYKRSAEHSGVSKGTSPSGRSPPMTMAWHGRCSKSAVGMQRQRRTWSLVNLIRRKKSCIWYRGTYIRMWAPVARQLHSPASSLYI